MANQYLIFCWHCQAEFDASSASDCSHANPTKTCPFCLKCFCDASKDYKKKYVRNCPKELLAEYTGAKDSSYLKIGEILVKAGKISIEQLDTVLDKQRIVNKKLGEVLIMMSLLTPDELQLYLLNQKNVETIDLKNIKNASPAVITAMRFFMKFSSWTIRKGLFSRKNICSSWTKKFLQPVI